MVLNANQGPSQTQSRKSISRESTEDIAWEDFQVVFDDMNFPLEKKRKRELEFKHFEQKGMSVVTYLVKFISLEMFAPGLVATKKIWANRFFEALIYTRILNSNVSVLCTSWNLVDSDMHVTNRA